MNINQSTQNAGMNAQTFSIGSGYRVDVRAAEHVVGDGDERRRQQPVQHLRHADRQRPVLPHQSRGRAVRRRAPASTSAASSPARCRSATPTRLPAATCSPTTAAPAASSTRARITALNGYVGLFAPQVINEGIIVARMGTVALAAGNQVTLDMVGDGLIKVAVDEAALNAAVMNNGTIEADGGNVLLTARSANALLDTVINTDGVIRANTIGNRNGTITLDGGDSGRRQRRRHHRSQGHRRRHHRRHRQGPRPIRRRRPARNDRDHQCLRRRRRRHDPDRRQLPGQRPGSERLPYLRWRGRGDHCGCSDAWKWRQDRHLVGRRYSFLWITECKRWSARWRWRQGRNFRQAPA